MQSTLRQLQYLLPAFDINDRMAFEHSRTSMFRNIWMIVDGTECRVKRQKSIYLQRIYYSGKKKYHSLKYNVVVAIASGLILSVTGPFPGSTHDLRMWRMWRERNEKFLFRSELVLADKAYISDDRCYCPYKSPKNKKLGWKKRLFNYLHGSVRVIVEQTIGRVKIFNILKSVYRGSLWKHKLYFFVCCQLANLTIMVSPLRTTTSQLL